MHNLENTFANPIMLNDEGYQAPNNFLILGLGESGVAMAKWCLRNGAKVSLADTRAREQLSPRQLAWLGELEFAGLQAAHFGVFNDSLLANVEVTKKHYGVGRRIFRMAPLHHHFELGGWKETQVVVRFWIITILLVLIGLSSLKLR